METEATTTGDEMKQLDARLKELKQIVATVGFIGTTMSTGRHSDLRDRPAVSASADGFRYGSASANASASARTSNVSLASTGPRVSPSYRDIIRSASSPAVGASSSPSRRGDLRGAASTSSRELPQDRGYSHAAAASSSRYPRSDWGQDASGAAVGGASPASPLRSPSLSPARSPPKSSMRTSSNSASNSHSNSNGHRVRLDSSRSPLEFSAGAGADLDTSRLSVDFEQALEQMLTSINQGAAADAPVPVQEIPTAAAGRVNHYRPASATGRSRVDSSRADVGYGAIAGAGATQSGAVNNNKSSTRISSLQRVDDRMLELKQEKDRLRRLLMNRVEDL